MSKSLMSERFSGRNDIEPSSVPQDKIPPVKRVNTVPKVNKSDSVMDRLKKQNAVQEPIQEKTPRKKLEYHIDDEIEEDPVNYEEDLEVSSVIAERKSRQKDELINRLIRTLQILLIIASVYMTYMIYGVFVTNYGYNEIGRVVPEVLSVAELSEKADYSSLESYYIRVQNLYKKTLELDYRLSLGQEDSLLIAMEYQSLLDTVDKLATDIAAEDVNTKYTAVYAQLNNWITTDIAVYLQNIASAITTNSEDKANKALIARNVMYDDYAQITQNMVVLAKNTKGIVLGETYSWSPDTYSEELGKGVA